MNSLILPRLYISCLHLYLSYTWFIINMFEIYYCKKSANIASRLNERNFIRFSNFLLLTLNDALQCSLHRCDSSNNYYFHTLPQEILIKVHRTTLLYNQDQDQLFAVGIKTICRTKYSNARNFQAVVISKYCYF